MSLQQPLASEEPALPGYSLKPPTIDNDNTTSRFSTSSSHTTASTQRSLVSHPISQFATQDSAPPSYGSLYTDEQPQRPRAPIDRPSPTPSEQKILLDALLKKHPWRRIQGPPPKTLASALKTACRHGRTRFVEDLLAAGADIPFTSRYAASKATCAVHEALRGPAPELALRLLTSRPACRASFSAQGCLLDARDEEGRAPLHLAASAGEREIVERLLELGAEIDALDHNGRTPLFSAARYKRVETMRYLVAMGADTRLVRKAWAGMDAELGRWEIVEVILSGGTDEKPNTSRQTFDYANEFGAPRTASSRSAPAQHLKPGPMAAMPSQGTTPLEAHPTRLEDIDDELVLDLGGRFFGKRPAHHIQSTWYSDEYKTWVTGLKTVQDEAKGRGGHLYSHIPWDDNDEPITDNT